ncbi:hypothetical protein Taro_056970 [Colocasia esculenta]|uniref:Uncharacterized protein n=1 Tax=Colocasia esculenta TaxID=4460 RepID=A0A843XYA4_COLES|nr:hypothetical protein [Colocasia esculenta]
MPRLITMARPTSSITTFLSALLLLSAGPLVFCRSVPTGDRGDTGPQQTYIVHVRPPAGTVFASSEDRQEWHRSFLPTVGTSSDASQMIYSYGNVISGFAATLSGEELQAMAAKEGFLHANPDRILPLQTTHTAEFLGLQLQDGFVKGSNFGRGVIVGLLDTGVYPDHPSFSDDGMPPPPAKWKGRCDFGASLCNNKLIGARTFVSGSAEGTPPVDDVGHGTHTASTAAGQFVNGAEVLEEALGTAAGMAPRAHLAIYKVCTEGGCMVSDILAAMDTAVEDGVDVLSLSLGGPSRPFYADDLAVGAFGAIEKGVFVSCAAGNSGPLASTLSNDAPWILTVAASTMDRSIRASVKLGNGAVVNGESLYQPKDFPSTPLPLVYAGASAKLGAAFCGNGSLDGLDVNGKAVLCERGGGIARISKGQTVKDAGGAGMILTNQVLDGYSTLADAHVLPASHVGYSDGSAVRTYIATSTNPTASFTFEGTLLGIAPAPTITSFSSRGPSKPSPGILKPDITGPGVSVLAAWPFTVGPPSAGVAGATTFNIISGTSMSTPHLSGIAALLKAANPDWSPAAIKSAIMTTADTLDRSGNPITDERRLQATFFALGSGHVNPTKAVDPGLVYDLTSDDYVPYLCGLNYTSTQVQAITRTSASCATADPIPQWDLNYPSISVILGSASVTVKRTVKNVGAASSIYTVAVHNPQGVSVSVEPPTLQFSTVGEEKSYTVTLSTAGSGEGVSEGQLVWSSGKYKVRSPISVTFH